MSPHRGRNSGAGRRDNPATASRQRVLITCAFCRGLGRDPFGILSPLATCQVCGGRGRHALRQPVAKCAFCRGSGVHPFSRMTCTACGGVGTAEVPDQAASCPYCGGRGRAAEYAHYVWPDSPLSCGLCRGIGVVFPEPGGVTDG